MTPEEKYQLQKEEAIEQVCDDGSYLEYLAPKFKDDTDVVLSAIGNNPWAFEHASERLQKDRAFAFEALQINHNVMVAMSSEFKDDKELVLASVSLNGLSLQHASARLQDNAEVVRASIQQNGMALEYASVPMQDDKELVMAAVASDARAVQFATYALLDDKDFMTDVVQHEGTALCYTTSRLCNNRELVMTAIESNPRALRNASDQLRNDPDVVLAALKGNASVMQYASKSLKDDTAFMAQAMDQSEGRHAFEIYRKASDRVQMEPEMILRAGDAITSTVWPEDFHPSNAAWDVEMLEHPILQYAAELHNNGEQDQWSSNHAVLAKQMDFIQTIEDARAAVASVRTGEIEAFELPSNLSPEFASSNYSYESALTGAKEKAMAQKEQDRDR